MADGADGRWDDHWLLTAALVASGVSDRDRLAQYEARFDRWAVELSREGRAGDPRRQARRILDFLHARILQGGYRLDATDLREALDEGRFNCTSASVLFNCLAQRLGMAVCGLELPGHAMSRVVFAQGSLDVETTSPASLKPQAASGSPAGGRAAPREVTDVQFVAMIYYNRGVDLLARRRFAEALASNAKALRLDPSNATARGNLFATLNNWAVALAKDGRYAEAAGLLRRGLLLDPGGEPLAANYVRVHRQWVDALCGQGRFDEALAVLCAAAEIRPDEPVFRGLRAEIRRQIGI